MSRLAIVLIWGVIAVFVWNVIFDLHVALGAREYLQTAAEAELGRAAPQAMQDVMNRAKHAGLTSATCWALVVFGAGVATMAVSRRRDR